MTRINSAIKFVAPELMDLSKMASKGLTKLKNSAIAKSVVNYIVRNQLHELGVFFATAATVLFFGKKVVRLETVSNFIEKVKVKLSDQEAYIKSIEASGIGKNMGMADLLDRQHKYVVAIDDFNASSSDEPIDMNNVFIQDCLFTLSNEIDASGSIESLIKLAEIKIRAKNCAPILNLIQQKLEPLMAKSTDEIALSIAKYQDNKTIMDALYDRYESSKADVIDGHILNDYLSGIINVGTGVISRLKEEIRNPATPLRRQLTLHMLVNKQKDLIKSTVELKSKLCQSLRAGEHKIVNDGGDDVDFGFHRKHKSGADSTTDAKVVDDKKKEQEYAEKKRNFNLGLNFKGFGFEVGVQTGYSSDKTFK